MTDRHNSDEPSFSLNDFRKWMSKQADDPIPATNHKKDLVGLRVESKISSKRLANRIDLQDGDLHEAIKDFHRNGGTVVERDGSMILIETDSGATFFVPKCYVRPVG